MKWLRIKAGTHNKLAKIKLELGQKTFSSTIFYLIKYYKRHKAEDKIEAD